MRGPKTPRELVLLALRYIHGRGAWVLADQYHVNRRIIRACADLLLRLSAEAALTDPLGLGMHESAAMAALVRAATLYLYTHDMTTPCRAYGCEPGLVHQAADMLLECLESTVYARDYHPPVSHHRSRNCSMRSFFVDARHVEGCYLVLTGLLSVDAVRRLTGIDGRVTLIATEFILRALEWAFVDRTKHTHRPCSTPTGWVSALDTCQPTCGLPRQRLLRPGMTLTSFSAEMAELGYRRERRSSGPATPAAMVHTVFTAPVTDLDVDVCFCFQLAWGQSTGAVCRRKHALVCFRYRERYVAYQDSLLRIPLFYTVEFNGRNILEVARDMRDHRLWRRWYGKPEFCQALLHIEQTPKEALCLLA